MLSVGEGVRKCGFELGNMEDGVDSSELLREVECDRVCSWSSYYFEWS